jgi:hypothetical protein
MKKKIQRKIDSKFLVSPEMNMWVDNIKDASSYNLEDYKITISTLLLEYTNNDLIIHNNYMIR